MLILRFRNYCVAQVHDTRKITYLRVSVTDRCSQRCLYCMPDGEPEALPPSDALTREEIVAAVAAGVQFGITKVRLTGGEPLLRPDIVELTAKLRGLRGVKELAMTTNGSLLATRAGDLRRAGLDRVNISMDSLRPERYAKITGGGILQNVLDGLCAAGEAGFAGTRVNVVLMKGVNDDEVADFATLAAARALEARFIELMPLKWPLNEWARLFIGRDEITMRLGDAHPLERIPAEASASAQTRWRIAGTHGIVGIIAPISAPFCGACNRLRLGADGRLRACLMEDGCVDIRPLLRPGPRMSDLIRAFARAAALKPARHSGTPNFNEMSRMGG